MSAGAVPSSEYLIESRILDANTPSITFDNLAQFAGVYKHFQILVSFKPASGNVNSWMRFNNDSGNNYSWHEIYTYSGSAVTSGALTNTNHIKAAYSDSGTANSFSSAIIDILDPYSSTKNTTARIFTGTTNDTFVALRSGLWLNTAPVSSITFLPDGGNNILAGSRFSLYGVTA
jgi:hypothetical protein